MIEIPFGKNNLRKQSLAFYGYNVELKLAAMDSTSIIIAAISPFVILVHIFAIVLVIKEKLITENQKCLIVSLSIVEICLGLGGFIRNLDQDFLKIFVFTTPALMAMFIMILITLDRFLAVYLNIKYELYCTRRKTIVLLLAAFLVAISFFAYVFLKNVLNPWNYRRWLYLYVYPVFGFGFVIYACLVYLYIYKKIKKNKAQRKKMMHRFKSNTRVTVTQHFKKNKFKLFVPGLIILNFILFMVVPITITMIIYVTNDDENIEIDHLPFVPALYTVSLLIDPFIYLFHMKSTKRICKRLLCKKNDIYPERRK